MGSLQPTSLPPRGRPNSPVRPSPLLVALPRGWRQGVRCSLRRLCLEQDLPPPTPSSPCPRSAIVSHCPGFRHGSSDLPGQHNHLDHGRPFLQDGPLRRPPETPVRGRNSGSPSDSCGPAARYPPGHRLGSWPPVYVEGVAGLLSWDWGHG